MVYNQGYCIQVLSTFYPPNYPYLSCSSAKASCSSHIWPIKFQGFSLSLYVNPTTEGEQIRFKITCKILDAYLENLARFQDLKFGEIEILCHLGVHKLA